MLKFFLGTYVLLVLGCAKHPNAPVERTTVGNGGNDVAVNFLADADNVLTYIETSYAATKYAAKRGVDLAKIRKLVSDTDAPVSVVDKSNAGVRNGKLYLDEEKWNEIYYNGKAKKSAVLEELLKVVGRDKDKVVMDQLLAYMNPTAVKQSVDFPGRVQMVGPYCGAKEILVTYDPIEKTISLNFDFSSFGFLDSFVSSHMLTAETLGRRECEIRIPMLPDWEVSTFSSDISTYATTSTLADVSVTIQARKESTQRYGKTISLQEGLINTFSLEKDSFLPSSGVLAHSSPKEDGILTLSISTQAHTFEDYMVLNPDQVRLYLK